MRYKITVTLGLFVSAIFLWLAFRNSELESIGTALAAAELALTAPFFFCLFAFYWLKSTRWKCLLSPVINAQSRDLFPIIMIGYAGTAVLPMQMGEFIRAYVASKKYSQPFALLLSSIAMERIFDLLTILALLGIMLASGQVLPEGLTKAGYVIAALTLIGFLTTVALVQYTEKTLSLFRIALSWLPIHITEKVLFSLAAASQGLESVSRPKLLIRISINSMLQWTLMGGCIYCSLVALDIQVPISGAILVLIATIIGISLPSSPGHVGNVQIAFVFALQPFDIPAAQSIAASIFYHVLAYLTVVIAGFTCAHKMGFGLLKIKEEAQASVTETHRI